MTKVKVCDSVDDTLLKFAVIISKRNGKWVFCKHKKRYSWNTGRTREYGETISETAKREPREETAPDNFDSNETFDMLYYAEIQAFEKELHSEIEKIIVTEKLVDSWTYPDIQPKLIEAAKICSASRLIFVCLISILS